MSSADLRLSESHKWLEIYQGLKDEAGHGLMDNFKPFGVVPPGMIGSLALVEGRNNDRFFFKLVGETIMANLGARLHHRYLDELNLNGFEIGMGALFTHTVEREEPDFLTGYYGLEDRPMIYFEGSVFPLYDKNKSVRLLLVGMAYQPAQLPTGI